MAAALGTCLLSAADLSSYRGFHFGMNLSQAAQQAGMKASETTGVHLRPALIQVLDFQPNLFHSSVEKDNAVSEIALTFYNGELARMAVTYDRYKVDGLTAGDLIEAVSATYGKAERPATEIAYHSYYSEVAPVLARWEDAEYSCNLIRVEDRSSFALVLYSKRLDVLAQAAIVEAVRLETLEAPQREAELAQKAAADNLALQEKSRLANKASFRP